jgi:hypothetical protein
VSSGLEQLVDSLLYEGYALYPYTPGATKNATPTPFGIAYPPAYAALSPSTFDHLRLECVLEADPDASLSAEVRFLVSAGPRHQAAPRRAELPAATLAAARRAPVERGAQVEVEGAPPLTIGLRLEVGGEEDGLARVRLRVENRTAVADADGLDRAGALARSLLSTHPLLRVRGGRFVSPLERPCESVNTFPVLATPADDAVLGAAIVLPDHPRIAPESLGSLFDATEIEEALLLHVHALSDGEREEIERQDPAVREMIARAQAATPQDIVGLHGRVTLRDPVTSEPPSPSPDLRDPSRGEDQVECEGVTFRRGAKVVLNPRPDADLHARMCRGRTATIERIFVDVGGGVHLGVTIDGDPGQELMRETNRLLFFFPPEVEPA